MKRPESFDENLSADWSIWVLDEGLPELPAVVARGESLPLARWAGPRFGAVLHVQWMWSPDPVEAPSDYLATTVQVLYRRGAAWELAGGEGGGLWDAPNLWAPPVRSSDVYFSGLSCSGGDGWYCCGAYGFAGSAAHFIEVVDTDGVTRLPAELAHSAFVVAFDGTAGATVKVLDSSQVLLAERTFDALSPA